jgi:hypothetical protein
MPKQSRKPKKRSVRKPAAKRTAKPAKKSAAKPAATPTSRPAAAPAMKLLSSGRFGIIIDGKRTAHTVPSIEDAEDMARHLCEPGHQMAIYDQDTNKIVKQL